MTEIDESALSPEAQEVLRRIRTLVVLEEIKEHEKRSWDMSAQRFRGEELDGSTGGIADPIPDTRGPLTDDWVPNPEPWVAPTGPPKGSVSAQVIGVVGDSPLLDALTDAGWSLSVVVPEPPEYNEGRYDQFNAPPSEPPTFTAVGVFDGVSKTQVATSLESLARICAV